MLARGGALGTMTALGSVVACAWVVGMEPCICCSLDRLPDAVMALCRPAGLGGVEARPEAGAGFAAGIGGALAMDGTVAIDAGVRVGGAEEGQR